MMNDLGRYLAFWPMPRGRANRSIDAGDAARNAGQWAQAAAHYRRAVTIQPRRRPIWVQLGHAEKEAGRPEAALEAYGRAMMLSANDGENGEAALHHGLQAKALGHFALAKTSFARAFAANPHSRAASYEWQELQHHPLAASAQDRSAAAALLRTERERLEKGPVPCPLIFEVTDLLRHFRHARLPTGVQRVQMEVICAAIHQKPGLRICCFADAQTGWVLIPTGQFLALCQLALADGDLFEPAWIEAVEILAATIGLAAQVGFARGDVLVNPGTSWTLPNYFLHLRHARRTSGLRYIPFVHDLIPVVASDYCLPGVAEDFLGWIAGVFDHADRFLTNSRSTAADLAQVAARLGRRVEDRDVRIIPLDAAMPEPRGETRSVVSLEQRGLAAGGYVLFVSSIEPRKNHLMALRAWQALIAQDAARTPVLVCVGHGGWLNDPVHEMLRDDPALAARVRILSGVADDELALLYRHCRFTLYPSHYEGWGMPVTESLCYGKVPLVTRCSSLTEAGGDFAVYVEPDDVEGLAGIVCDLWQDAGRLAALEEHIARDFRPRDWAQLAKQFCDEASGPYGPAPGDVPQIRLDSVCRMGRNMAVHLQPDMLPGEGLRHGLGWEPLASDYALTRPEGGMLAFRVTGDHVRITCHFRLAALDGKAVPSVRSAQQLHQPDWAAAGHGWLSFAAPVVDGQVDLWLSGGAALSHLLVTDAANPALTIARIMTDARTHYAFLRDVHLLIMGEEADAATMVELLPSLESGGLTRPEIVTMLRRRASGKGL